MDGEKRRFGFWNPSPTRHTPLEDAQGLFASSMIAALGLALMGSAGLVASGTAGVAFILHYLTGVSFGLNYTVVNIPFYVLALKRLGWAFTIKTILAVAMTSGITELQPHFVRIESIDPKTREHLEKVYFGKSFEAVYDDVRAYFSAAEIEKAESVPKYKMALIFKWYFGRSSRLAMTGASESRVDYQVHSGPALGAFNRSYLKGMLAKTNGNVTAAAALAGLDRSNFRRLLKQYSVLPKRGPVAVKTVASP